MVTILRACWDLLETTKVINMRELAIEQEKEDLIFDFEDVHTPGVGVVERVRESVGQGQPTGRGMKHIS